MSTVKDEAIRVIDALPDDATWEDVLYAIYVNQKIAAGLKDAEEGHVVPHAEVLSRFGVR